MAAARGLPHRTAFMVIVSILDPANQEATPTALPSNAKKLQNSVPLVPSAENLFPVAVIREPVNLLPTEESLVADLMIVQPIPEQNVKKWEIALQAVQLKAVVPAQNLMN